MIRDTFPYWPMYAARPDLPMIGGRLRHQLLDDFVQDVGGRHITVPAGYIFDGASIPSLLKSLTGGSYDRPYILPAIVHDFGYDVNGKPGALDYVDDPVPRHIARILPDGWRDHFRACVLEEQLNRRCRATCDAHFYDGMRAAGVPKWKALLMYLAVRVGGGKHFRHKPKQGPTLVGG